MPCWRRSAAKERLAPLSRLRRPADPSPDGRPSPNQGGRRPGRPSPSLNPDGRRPGRPSPSLGGPIERLPLAS